MLEWDPLLDGLVRITKQAYGIVGKEGFVEEAAPL
jgi:hypothetical protein